MSSAIVPPSVIPVVAGLLYRDGKLLVCQRRSDAAFALKWEFPGGKVEVGESDEAALRRELREELDVEIGRMILLDCHEYRYSAGPTVALRFYRVFDFAGEVRNLVFEQIAWVELGKLSGLDFLEGDRPIIEKFSRDGETFLLRA